MPTTIHSLPPEIHVKILTWLSAKDIKNAAQVCKKFYEASKVETLWQIRLMKDFQLTGSCIKDHSFYDFYTKLLHPYGYLLGFWQLSRDPYGGLARVQVKDGEIIAHEYLPPEDSKVWDPVDTKELFRIAIDSDRRAYILCLTGANEPHEMKIKENGDGQFSIKCSKSDMHTHNNRVLRIDQRLEPFRNFLFVDYGLHLAKQRIVEQFETKCVFHQLTLQPNLTNVPIQPGLFRGSYGSHGTEIINIQFENNRLHGMKVTGDPNVPAGKLSLLVHLDEPMVLRKDHQETLQIIAALNKDEVLYQGEEDPPVQPFVMPDGVHDRELASLMSHNSLRLDVCKRRYYGSGLIAMHGFKSSSRTLGHFIIFNEDLCAFLWMELQSISVYVRATEIT